MEVQVLQTLPREQKVVKTFKTTYDRALSFQEKFPQTYRVLSPMKEPKKVEQPKTATPATFMEEQKKKDSTFELIQKIQSVTKENISDLEPFLSHEMKTVKKAAEKKMKELMNINS